MNARQAVEALQKGRTVYGHRESGNSMAPLIEHREPVTLAPCDPRELEVGDIVLAKVSGKFYLHKITAVECSRVQIGNNKGRINGWTPLDHVYGIVTHISGIKRGSAKAKVRQVLPGD